MIFPALPDSTLPADDLNAVRLHLMAIRDSLRKACRDLDEQIRELDAHPAPVVLVTGPPPASPALFESAPVLPSKVEPTLDEEDHHATGSVVLPASEPSALAPELEQATLEELNAALSKAFSQIAGRVQW